jgi:hypothetical protein
MIRYILVSDIDTDYLEVRVNDALEDGWQLQGGVSVGPNQYVQAMIKEEMG